MKRPTRASMRANVGCSLDVMLERASRAGYGCRVIYDKAVMQPKSRHELVVWTKDEIVTKIR